MSYLPVGDPESGEPPLTEEEERFVRYEIPKERLDLDKKRLEHTKSMAKWDVLQAFASGVVPILAMLGIVGADRARRKL